MDALSCLHDLEHLHMSAEENGIERFGVLNLPPKLKSLLLSLKLTILLIYWNYIKYNIFSYNTRFGDKAAAQLGKCLEGLRKLRSL